MRKMKDGGISVTISRAMRSRAGRVRNYLGLLVGGIVLSSCSLPSFSAYHGATTQGNSTYHLFQFFAILAIPVLLTVFVPLAYAVYKFRRKDDAIPKQTHTNIKMEVTYTVIPVVLIVILFIFTVRVENKVTAVSAHPQLRISVTAYQWGWKFYYPSLGITVHTKGNVYPEMVLPKGETTTITLVSQDVIHGFYIPQFDFSRYALPGVTNRFDFTPTQNGTFIGRCSQLCGLYHSEMLFQVKVVSPSGFNSWASQQSTNTTGAAA